MKYDGIYYIDINRAITESTNFVSANAAITQLRLIATPPPSWGDDTKARALREIFQHPVIRLDCVMHMVRIKDF